MNSGHLTPVLLITAIFTSCPPPVNEVVVGATPNIHRCETCWVSTRDNPHVKMIAPLGTSKGPSGEDLYEYAGANSFGFNYSNVRFDLFVKGNDAAGASSMDELRPGPQTSGDWQAEPSKPKVLLPLEVRGIELGYDLSEAEAVHRDAIDHPTNLFPPLKVELASNIMLVPIQDIRVMPPDMTSSLAQQVTRFTKDAHKEYWDDRPNLDTFRASEPGIPNHYAQHKYNSPKMPWDSADDIWAQCGIQFRMIACPGLDEGCPDLHVDDDARVAATTCVRGFAAAASQNWNDARGLPGVDPGLPIVLFMDRVTSIGCDFSDVAKTGEAAVGYSTATYHSSLVLPHELGHVLGLNDDDHCQNLDQGHLMCAEDNLQTEKIRAEDCARARQKAASFVKQKWGVTVTP